MLTFRHFSTTRPSCQQTYDDINAVDVPRRKGSLKRIAIKLFVDKTEESRVTLQILHWILAKTS